MWKERYQFVEENEEVRDNAHNMDKKIPQRNGISCKNLKHFSYYHKKKKKLEMISNKRWKIPMELKCEDNIYVKKRSCRTKGNSISCRVNHEPQISIYLLRTIVEREKHAQNSIFIEKI